MASSSDHVRNYDVFLSFRGEDTRPTIISYLYEALGRQGIFTFKDDQQLQIGNNISNQLIEAMKMSWFAIVVISENYATSKWCLEELRMIMELRDANRIQVVPIFYKVEPSDVRHQTGSFEAAFQKHEDLDTDPERVSQWRRALNQVGHLAGFDSTTYLDEAAMVSDTVRSISSQLLDMRRPSGVGLVGMEAHMMKMHFLLNMESENDVLMMGIWGMGGVGKTTIAKCLYDRLSRHFPARYFIEDIKKIYKDKSLSYLQQSFLFTILHGQLHIGFQSDEARSQEIKARLGHKKVLLVLDGVDKAEQVHALARDGSWFGPGSRIIITTQDKGLLNSCGVNNVHEVKCLDDKDSLQVFEKLAFRGKPPPSDGFQQLFIKASRLAHGLPSALVAYASYLSENETIESWEDELSILETRPHMNVEEILRNSFNGLYDQEKIAFLRVACLFNGYPFNHVTSFFYTGRPTMNHLIAKSLISISMDECINMHFLIVLTGRAIVRQESRNMPYKQRFLWDHTEIYDVLDSNTGTCEIEGVTLHMCEMTDKLPLGIKSFNVMNSIKFLNFFQHLRDAESNVQLGQDGIKFPRNLRLLHWDTYPLQTLSLFRHHHLVQLDLRYSNLKRLWDGSANLRSLLRLDVTGSQSLMELPDFSTAKKLEEVVIEGCISLPPIPIPKESLRSLDRLTKFNAIQCKIFWGDTLRIGGRISGSHWETIIMYPNEEMQFNLTDLSIQGKLHLTLTDLYGKADHFSFGSKQQLPDHVMSYPNSAMKSLKIMRFSTREAVNHFCCLSFRNFPCLTELKLTNLSIRYIPENISDLQLLETLDLSGNDFEHLPKTMRRLVKLKYLKLRKCGELILLPKLAQVEILILSDCVNLRSLPELDDIDCLLELWLDNCKEVVSLSQQLNRFRKLTYLDLSRNDFESVPGRIRELTSLQTLFLNNCKKLKSLEHEFQLPESVEYLHAHGCDSLERVTLSPNHSIKHLDLHHSRRMNREEHKHLLHLLQKESRACVCIWETGESSNTVHPSTAISWTANIFQSIKSVFTNVGISLKNKEA